MLNLPSLKPREVEEILLNAGFEKRKTKSAHRRYWNVKTQKQTVVSFHPGDVPTGTLRAIIRQSGMTAEEFLAFRKKKVG